MRRVKFGIAATLIGALVAVSAGCGGSDPGEAQTPTDAVTITNGQTAAATDTGSGSGGAGDVAAGKTTFEGACQGCHLAGGTQAGAGPKLAGLGIDAAAVQKQIETPIGTMPPNLVSGADMENVIAYVVSLEGNKAGGSTPAAGGTKTTPAGTDTAAAGGAEGDVAAGKTFFEGTCQGCHMADGSQAGAGPKLAGAGLTADAIQKQIETPAGTMPPGLATGDDLKNVVAFVLSIQ